MYSDSITLDAPTATLVFRGYVYGDSSGWADVQVENGSGQVLYSAHIVAYGGEMSWNCVVPSGASYKMVCTGGWDGYEGMYFGGSSYWTPVVVKDQVVEWTFYDGR